MKWREIFETLYSVKIDERVSRGLNKPARQADYVTYNSIFALRPILVYRTRDFRCKPKGGVKKPALKEQRKTGGVRKRQAFFLLRLCTNQS